MLELNIQTIVFAICSIITLGSAIGVVWNRNLVSSSYWLIFSLFGVAGLFVLLSAPFLAAVQVLVYIGAIGILITFSVMLTRGMTHIQDVFNNQSRLTAVVAVLLFLVLVVGVVLQQLLCVRPDGWSGLGAKPLMWWRRLPADLGVLMGRNRLSVPDAGDIPLLAKR
ncbi:MAG: NADH-quinone oxidoreductase subunit J [Anaerolineae bacterium]